MVERLPSVLEGLGLIPSTGGGGEFASCVTLRSSLYFALSVSQPMHWDDVILVSYLTVLPREGDSGSRSLSGIHSLEL